MKQLLTALFCCISLQFFSQYSYHFDNYVVYENTIKTDGESNKHEHQYFVNSKNHSYEMILVRGEAEKIILKVLDFENYYTHFFELKKKDFPYADSDFVYLYSIEEKLFKKQFNDEDKRRFFSYKPIKEANSSYNFEISEYRNAKMKSLTQKFKVELVPYTGDLAVVGLGLAADYYGIYKKLSFPENFVMKSSLSNYNTIKIVAVEPQNFTLKIDKIVYQNTPQK